MSQSGAAGVPSDARAIPIGNTTEGSARGRRESRTDTDAAADALPGQTECPRNGRRKLVTDK